jgi:transcriptional regulator with XRE-family HTH domain
MAEGSRGMDGRLGERLAAVRKERWPNLSVTMARTHLAVEVGVTVNAITHIEKGRSDPRASTLYGLCTALGVSADYLLGLTDNPVAP